MNFIASKTYKLVANQDLAPGGKIVTGNAIKALHCIIQPESDVVVRTMDNQVINFPASAFVAGAIYPYQIRQINAEGAKCFLGLSHD